MKINSVKETLISDTPHKVDVRKLYDRENEGTPEVPVGDERVTAEADNLIESPRDIPHCLYNSSDSLARILVVKAPKPVQQSRLL